MNQVIRNKFEKYIKKKQKKLELKYEYSTSSISVSRLTFTHLSGRSSAQKLLFLISFLQNHNRSNCTKNVTKLPIKITITMDCSIFAYHDINQKKKITKLPNVRAQLPRCSIGTKWFPSFGLVSTTFNFPLTWLIKKP